MACLRCQRQKAKVYELAFASFADRPFRLGHLEISFGICSKLEIPANRARFERPNRSIPVL